MTTPSLRRCAPVPKRAAKSDPLFPPPNSTCALREHSTQVSPLPLTTVFTHTNTVDISPPPPPPPPSLLGTHRAPPRPTAPHPVSQRGEPASVSVRCLGASAPTSLARAALLAGSLARAALLAGSLARAALLAGSLARAALLAGISQSTFRISSPVETCDGVARRVPQPRGHPPRHAHLQHSRPLPRRGPGAAQPAPLRGPPRHRAP